MVLGFYSAEAIRIRKRPLIRARQSSLNYFVERARRINDERKWHSGLGHR